MTCATILEVVVNGFVGFFTALFGAGAGAYAAYFLAKRQEEEKRRVECHGHAIAAFYTLLARYSALENFSRKFLNDSRDLLADEYVLALVYQHCPRDPISLRSLAFMGDSKDSDLLYALTVSEARYFDFIDAYETRNVDLKAAILVLQGEGYSPGELIPVALLDRPEVKFVFIQNGNLVRALKGALKGVGEEVERLSASIKVRFDGLPAPYIATPKE
jgi:hypothetical protein